jgi:hypothetical protein
VVVIRRREVASIWCAECGAEVKALRPETAAAVIGMSLRAVFRLVEAGHLHPCETGEGMLFICLNSLPTSICEGDHQNGTDQG